jgi:hypothetical protein
MDCIPGFEKDGYCIKLVRALYGLKQSPKHWADLLSKTLTDMGYKRANFDSCLYTYKCPKTKREINIACYVDDLLVSGCTEFIDELVATLQKRFTVRDMGEAKTFLGMEIERDRKKRTLTIKQSTYIKNIAEKFDVQNSHKSSIPMDPGYKPTKSDKQSDKNKAENRPDYDMFVTEYRSIIGSCMYAQMLTRPDIAFTVSALSKYLNAPTLTHMKAARKLLTYLYHTHDRGITYGLAQDLTCVGWSDSDYAGDLDTRKSQTGWVFMLNGGAISWCSRQQNCVALSTPEAEYMAVSDAGKEARSLLKLCVDMFDGKQTCITIYEDNKTAEIWTRQTSHQSKTKQIDISYHHIRDEVAKNRIKIAPIASRLNLADALTKALSRGQFEALNDKISGRVLPTYYT